MKDKAKLDRRAMICLRVPLELNLRIDYAVFLARSRSHERVNRSDLIITALEEAMPQLPQLPKKP